MPNKVSIIFNLATAPTDLAQANVHTGGWSETFWTDLDGDALLARLAVLAGRRALLLGASASITGYRIQQYTIARNILIAGGSSAGGLRLPGFSAAVTDMPQVALEYKCSAAGKNNSSRKTLRGIIDSQIVGGEYQPTTVYRGAVTRFFTELTSGVWSFPGRDLSNPSMRILGITNLGVITVDGVVGIALGDYVRLLRVRDNTGFPVEGSFEVTAATLTTITVRDWKGATVGASGRLRKDNVVMCTISAASPTRSVVRKIGRPTEGYRGRRSKRR